MTNEEKIKALEDRIRDLEEKLERELEQVYDSLGRFEFVHERINSIRDRISGDS